MQCQHTESHSIKQFFQKHFELQFRAFSPNLIIQLKSLGLQRSYMAITSLMLLGRAGENAPRVVMTRQTMYM